MKKILGGLIILGAVISMVWTQAPIHEITFPSLPSREVLYRLNLTLSWRTRLILKGQRYGIFSAQLLFDGETPQMVVQSRAGTVFMLDAETGTLLWQTPVGEPYLENHQVAHNLDSIFTIRRNHLYILSRKTGKQRLFTLDKDSKQPIYGMKLIGPPSTRPVANQNYLFLPTGNRISAYGLSLYETATKSVRETTPGVPSETSGPSDAPEYKWGRTILQGEVHQPPLLTKNQVAFVTNNGTLYALNQVAPPEIPEQST